VIERVCFLLKVRPERLADIRSATRRCGRRSDGAARNRVAELFAVSADDGLLVGYLETPDFAAALRGMAGREIRAMAAGDGAVL